MKDGKSYMTITEQRDLQMAKLFSLRVKCRDTKCQASRLAQPYPPLHKL